MPIRGDCGGDFKSAAESWLKLGLEFRKAAKSVIDGVDCARSLRKAYDSGRQALSSGSASDGDTTSFRIGMKFEPLGLFGSKYDSEGDPPVEGFVTASNSVVPEPTSLAIFCCLGLCPLYYRRR